jgi:two-component system CheB/CheR fusion protein
VDAKSRIYRRLESGPAAESVEFPSSFFAPPPAVPVESRAPVLTPNIQTQADQLLLTHYAPAAVLATNKGDIVYISGRTGKYLEPAAGKVNWNLFAMAREGLRYDLTGGFQRAARERSTIVLKGVKVGTNGGTQVVDVTIQALTEPDTLREMVLVVFRDVVAPATRKRRTPGQGLSAQSAQIAEMAQECEQARHELQTTREEMQASQEELRSMNEELQSGNEELQSTNEELTTSKEEMQSMNEELQTVNNELQAKVADLSTVNNDMKNLLDSTDIATLFLDDQLNVRRFTSRASQIIKLIPGDAGRPITDIASELIYPELVEDADEVLRKISLKEKLVTASGGRWFWVRIMPYRTLDKRIDGLVMTFMDITASKKLEMELRNTNTALEKQVAEQSLQLGELRRHPRGSAGLQEWTKPEAPTGKKTVEGKEPAS